MTGWDDQGPIAPRATYRLQLRGGVGLREATSLLPYLSSLGVSHVYCSPYMQAREGSSHGYDVTDPRRLDPAVGSEADLEAFVAELRRHAMGQILDWVPNHVGIAMGQNPWWQNLLAFGPSSPYADFFDVDWSPGRRELRGKVLLPVLGDRYGEVLERGELEPALGAEGGLEVRYFEHRFPVSPASWGRLLLRRLGADAGPDDPDAPAALPRHLAAMTSRTGSRATRAQRALDAQRALGERVEADPQLRQRVDAVVQSLRGEPGSPATFDALHRLLEAQHYRLAYWRVSAEEINYRRFFDIDELAAVRMERPEVFEYVHERVFEWIEAGWVDGLRIDHIDGLADPRGYCERVRRRYGADRLLLLVEKILAVDEALPSDWPVDGTTGYEFLNELNGLFVSSRAETALDRLYRSFTGDARSVEAVVRSSKQRVMRALLASELDGLTSALDRLAQGDRHTRDYTTRSLRVALGDVVSAFDVYRTYVGPKGARPEDRARIERAVAEAKRRAEDPDSGLYEWLADILTGDLARDERSSARRRELQRFVTRLEQYTAPVMAKGLEDTAFYRFHRLLSLNEVGGEPGRFGVSPATFHAANRTRAERHPRGLLSTATHDTKRGEDVRARLDVLSEWPGDWAGQVRAWARLNERLRRRVDGEPAPSRTDEYFLYQVLVGSFPLETPDADILAKYAERVRQYLVKALREGKERSSWRHPHEAYEAAVTEFASDLLSHGSEFLDAFLPFQRAVAERGALNGLSQLTLKLTAPGVPDIYQGCEQWDLSLADPDNRRPVDFEARRAVQAELARLVDVEDRIDDAALSSLCEQWQDGRIKHLVTWRLLEVRRRRPELFAAGGYVPLMPTGNRAQQLCGYSRTHGRERLLVLAPRLCADVPCSSGPFPLGGEAWADTWLPLPPECEGRRWRDVVTGARVESTDGEKRRALDVARLFARLPLAVLVPDESDTEDTSDAEDTDEA